MCPVLLRIPTELNIIFDLRQELLAIFYCTISSSDGIYKECRKIFPFDTLRLELYNGGWFILRKWQLENIWYMKVYLDILSYCHRFYFCPIKTISWVVLRRYSNIRDCLIQIYFAHVSKPQYLFNVILAEIAKKLVIIYM